MTHLPWLNPYKLEFPPADQALEDPNGLLAAGGDLSPERLLCAYRQGIFPWYEEDQPILWWSPDPRAVIFAENLKISRSLRKSLRGDKFTVTRDKAFLAVIENCSGPRRKSSGTWITPEMKKAYMTLHQQGYAHSVETWMGDRLVGGLYGVNIGNMFFGESMFSIETDASKVAFCYMVLNLTKYGFPFIDCQVPNNHLMSLGATKMSRAEYLQQLSQCVEYGNQLLSPWKDPWDNPLELK